ncbi:MAG: hypothetical protein IH840_15380 [Candidatus Heimdallarchaeota archaeon]|nr:hypothetical protein [Candidatus Heimdallarchaeota archaeon]
MVGTENKLEFDEEKMKKAIQGYSRVDITEEQEEMIDMFAEILHDSVGLWKNMLRSFIYISISLWQKEKQAFAKDFASADPKIRLENILQAAEKLRTLLRGVLKKSGQEERLDQAINQGLSVYQQKWMYRE